MTPEELAHCQALLGVSPEVTLTELERVFMKKNFALIKGRSGAADEVNPELEADRAKLKAAYEKLGAHLRGLEEAAKAAAKSSSVEPGLRTGLARPEVGLHQNTPPKLEPRREPGEFAPWSFDNWTVSVIVPPLLLVLVWVQGFTFFAFMRQGPTICVHELGHATAAWLSGWRATPLPWGWTPVEPVHSNAVYFGLLLLLVLLAVAGVKERKFWPVVIAVALAALQYVMTWRLTDYQKDFYVVFGGVGGEFAISTLLMLSFWVRLPDKFKWGWVRYLAFLVGAMAFLAIWQRWQHIYRGAEELPFGSMINGEDDQGGDMNRLMDDYGWKKFTIRRTYWLLGWWCWAALGAVWLIHVLKADRLGGWVAGKFMKQGAGSEEQGV